VILSQGRYAASTGQFVDFPHYPISLGSELTATKRSATRQWRIEDVLGLDLRKHKGRTTEGLASRRSIVAFLDEV
jgi:hypothetical protein